MWIEFLVTSFVVVVVPGTGVIYTIGVGMSRGVSASVAAAAGCTCGIIPAMAAAIAGLAAVLHASAVAFQAIKWAGILYLLYLAWSVLRDKGSISFDTKSGSGSLRKVAMTGFLINILNPKLSIFFLAFLPQFVPAETLHPLAHMLLLSGIFMAMTFAIFVLYGAFAAKIRSHVEGTPSILAWMKRGFSLAFLMLAAKLAFETD
ncbi:LysE family translocator [Heliomarina baculiformis]|uniref:LysE family translocator n=1 Tax=Heliomarina baculiformis TaxID=2872036 RepID=UPI0023560540|nr:LysE family translocator [Heliomarina baculiformis]